MNTDKAADMRQGATAILGILLSNSSPKRQNLVWSKPFIYSNFIPTDPSMRAFWLRNAPNRAYWRLPCSQNNSDYPRIISGVFYNQPEEEDI